MKRRGPWSSQQVESFLERTRIPLRLACNAESGHPLLASLWFVPLEGRLWCATRDRARIVSAIWDDPRCSFEVSVETPPYYGVRGTAYATLHPERGEEILRVLIDRYLKDAQSPFAQWLLDRAADETAIALEPARLRSWDYRERMGAAA